MIWILLAILTATIRAFYGVTHVDGSLILILALAVIGCIRITRPAPTRKGNQK